MVSGRLAQWYSTLRSWGLRAGIAAALALGSLGSPGFLESQAQAAPVAALPSTEAVVRLEELPAEARDVHQRILAGGPFAHDRDGVVFGNREHLLPARPRGWYREYTVAKPGARDRGPRRIVCGGHQPRNPEACFYTADHYNTFRRISP